MAWTAPMTAVSGNAFTAAQFNTNVRDNLLETAPAKATATAGYYVGTGPNAIAERFATAATVNTSQSTTSTAFVDLATVGPAVTVTTGTTALVFITSEIGCNVVSEAGRVGYAVSGATTIAVDGNHVLRQETNGTTEFQRCTVARLQTGLTPGTNTFTLKYATTNASNTASFNFRHIVVLPF